METTTGWRVILAEFGLEIIAEETQASSFTRLILEPMRESQARGQAGCLRSQGGRRA